MKQNFDYDQKHYMSSCYSTDEIHILQPRLLVTAYLYTCYKFKITLK